ncbi:MAG: M48 family metallopeptidase [Fermentimonas sp.]|jgi:predicted metal-dependent hydrolase
MIQYTIVKSSRKSIAIHVYPDGDVIVRAPYSVSEKEIIQVVSKRSEWIQKHLKKFAQNRKHYDKYNFTDGLSHPFLGDYYTLKVFKAYTNRVYINNDQIVVECEDYTQVQQLLKNWYWQQAEKIFPGYIDKAVDTFSSRYKVKPNKVTLKDMKSKWGSCSSKRNISINMQLIKFPIDCLEYVIAHELCHLLQMNHSSSFYALLNEFMPDWSEKKQKLKSLIY